MLVFPFNNIISKYILTKKTKDVVSYNLMTYVFDTFAIALLSVILSIKFDFSSALAMLSGFTFVFLWIIWFRTVRDEEVSRAAMTRSGAPIIVLLLSTVFLKESLDFNKYLGIFMLAGSTFLASYKKSGKKFHLSSTFATMLLFVFGTACMSILSKYTLNFTDYWNFYFWSIVGGQIGSLILITQTSIRKRFVKTSLSIGRKTWLILTFSYILYFIGWLSYYIALSIGNVSVVYSMVSARPIILFVYALALTRFMPHVLKEDVSQASLIMKSLAGILIIVGSYLIII